MVTPSVHATAPPAPVIKGAARNVALDFTKGFLVLLMVLYHWFNYFVGSSRVYDFIRFITPSFIFIAGFIVANIYFVKYDLRDRRLPARLATRGLKIIAVFIVLNAIIALLPDNGIHRPPLQQVVLNQFFGTTTPGAKEAAFGVLMPIGQLLLVCAALVFGYRLSRYVVHAFCLFTFVLVVVLGVLGIHNANVPLIAIGSLGILLGTVPADRMLGIINRPVLLAILYVLFDLAVARWRQPFILQVIGVCLSIAVMYVVGASKWAHGWLGRISVLLGKYSLFGYIVQIAILQVMRRAMPRSLTEFSVLAISFVLAFVLTTWSVMLLNVTRSRSPLVDRSYKLVFA